MRITKANNTNLIRVLRTIWLNEGISRIEIAEKLGLDKSTISNLTASLYDRKIIKEMEEGNAGPQGGRKPIKLKISKNYCAVMGIEVQPEYCNVICVNLEGEVLIYKQFVADITAYSFPVVFKHILDEVGIQMNEMNIPLAGIGLGLSGIINPEDGVICQSIPLGVTTEYRILDELSMLTDVPVFIDNDGNCCCWGELIFNKTEELQDFLFCLVEFRKHHSAKATYGGLAVGMGIVIGGKVHYGKKFTAGEFRSVFADKDKCGQFSCGKQNEFKVQEVPELFHEFSVELSKNLALLANTFALSECFIGGDLESYKDSFIKVFKNELDRNWNYPGESDCRIRCSSLEKRAVAYGAASMIIDRLFTVPGPEDSGSERFENFFNA